MTPDPMAGGRRDVRLVLVVCLACVLLSVPPGSDDDLEPAVVFGAAFALCLAVLTRTGWYRPSTAYLALFGLFHGGLLVTIAVRGPDATVVADTSWLGSGYTADAVRLAVIGMVAFTVCAELGAGAPVRERVSGEPAAETGFRNGFALVGLAAELTGLVVVAWTVARIGSLELLRTGAYQEFLLVAEADGVLGYGTLLIGAGAVLAVVAGGRARVLAWSGFAAYAVVGLLIGTRGAVLFPLLALLVVESRRGRRLPTGWAVIAVPAVLTAVGLLRTWRLPDGTAAASSLWAAPLDAIAEMGYSLRPVLEVLSWHDHGEPFQYGQSLVAVPLRFFESLTGWHGGPPVHDERLFNVVILDRVGPVGGSPVAEGYHNAGLLGVLLLLGAIGVVIGLLERRPCTPRNDALLGVVLLPLLVQVRNGFAPVPVHIAVGVSLVLIASVLSRRRNTPVADRKVART